MVGNSWPIAISITLRGGHMDLVKWGGMLAKKGRKLDYAINLDRLASALHTSGPMGGASVPNRSQKVARNGRAWAPRHRRSRCVSSASTSHPAREGQGVGCWDVSTATA